MDFCTLEHQEAARKGGSEMRKFKIIMKRE